MAMLFSTPQEYMTQQRPVDPQVDMRNLLAALGSSFQAPNTSYFGLTPSEVAASAGMTQRALSEAAGQIQHAQQMGVQQERNQFQDAATAHQMYLADRDQQQQEALRALQMAQIKQNMSQSAASHQLAQQAAKTKLALAQFLSGKTIDTPLGPMPADQAIALGYKPFEKKKEPSALQQKIEFNKSTLVPYGIVGDGSQNANDYRKALNKGVSDLMKLPQNMMKDDEKGQKELYATVGRGLGLTEAQSHHLGMGIVPAPVQNGPAVGAPQQTVDPALELLNSNPAIVEALQRISAGWSKREKK